MKDSEERIEMELIGLCKRFRELEDKALRKQSGLWPFLAVLNREIESMGRTFLEMHGINTTPKPPKRKRTPSTDAAPTPPASPLARKRRRGKA